MNKNTNKKKLSTILYSSLVGFMARFYRNLFPDTWLIFSRPDEKDGNAYAFYQWAKKKKRCYFLMEKDSDLFEPDMIPWGSMKHLFLSSIASAHVFDVTSSGDFIGRGVRKRIGLKTKYVFLQHGLTRVDIPMYHYDQTNYDYFITTGRREHQFAKEVFGYPEDHLALTGQARYDDLLQYASDKGFILIMPTWRKELNKDCDSFTNSEFYVRFQSLLKNEVFLTLLKNNQIKIRLYLHYMIKDKIDLFTIPSDIEIYDETDSVHELLRDCSLLITDYSSVSFDVALAGKPIIYYQFQADQYNSAESYFQYERDGYGPVVREEGSLIKEILGCWNGSCFEQSAIYKNRMNNFFEFHDTNHCQRIYDCITANK